MERGAGPSSPSGPCSGPCSVRRSTPPGARTATSTPPSAGRSPTSVTTATSGRAHRRRSGARPCPSRVSWREVESSTGRPRRRASSPTWARPRKAWAADRAAGRSPATSGSAPLSLSAVTSRPPVRPGGRLAVLFQDGPGEPADTSPSRRHGARDLEHTFPAAGSATPGSCTTSWTPRRHARGPGVPDGVGRGADSSRRTRCRRRPSSADCAPSGCWRRPAGPRGWSRRAPRSSGSTAGPAGTDAIGWPAGVQPSGAQVGGAVEVEHGADHQLRIRGGEVPMAAATSWGRATRPKGLCARTWSRRAGRPPLAIRSRRTPVRPSRRRSVRGQRDRQRLAERVSAGLGRPVRGMVRLPPERAPGADVDDPPAATRSIMCRATW